MFVGLIVLIFVSILCRGNRLWLMCALVAWGGVLLLWGLCCRIYFEIHYDCDCCASCWMSAVVVVTCLLFGALVLRWGAVFLGLLSSWVCMFV